MSRLRTFALDDATGRITVNVLRLFGNAGTISSNLLPLP